MGNEFKYPVTCTDAADILKRTVVKTSIIPTPTRWQEIESFRTTVDNSYKFDVCGKVSFENYVKLSLKSSAGFHPNGIAIRHAVYEQMCLGIPTIVSSNKYVPDSIKKFCLIVDNSTTIDQIDEFINTVDEDEIIDYWENYMTPERIIKNVFDQIVRLETVIP